MSNASQTWILIADAASARVLEAKGPGRKLVPVTDFPVTRASPPRATNERPTRVHEALGHVRHAVEPKSTPRRAARHRFAAALAAALADTVERYDRLVIVAPPATLGDLRSALVPSVTRKVIAEVAKDLVKTPDEAIRSHLEAVAAV